MKQKKKQYQDLSIRNIVARFSNKWALLIILAIYENNILRYTQLMRQIPGISSKALTNTLRVLEADNLVNRTIYREIPIRVEYKLKKTGLSLVPTIQSLVDWAVLNMKAIIKHREEYEAKEKASVKLDNHR